MPAASACPAGALLIIFHCNTLNITLFFFSVFKACEGKAPAAYSEMSALPFGVFWGAEDGTDGKIIIIIYFFKLNK